MSSSSGPCKHPPHLLRTHSNEKDYDSDSNGIAYVKQSKGTQDVNGHVGQHYNQTSNNTQHYTHGDNGKPYLQNVSQEKLCESNNNDNNAQEDRRKQKSIVPLVVADIGEPSTKHGRSEPPFTRSDLINPGYVESGKGEPMGIGQ